MAIEQKIGSLGTQLEGSAAALALAEDNLADRRAILLRRLTDIYKRGPLYTFQVMLTAESFGDLLARYKYLYLTSRQDRYDLSEFQKLTQRVRVERNDLLGLRTEYDRTRGEREVELQNYARLAEERQAQLRELERNSARTKQRITALERDEAQLVATLAALEKARKVPVPGRGASRAPAPGSDAGSLNTSDIGKLDWPVDGTIIYNFGRDSLPSGAVVRHNGIGIRAPAGTPVKAVETRPGGAGATAGDLRPHCLPAARQRLLLALHAAPVGVGEGRPAAHAWPGARHGGRSRTSRKDRISISRFAATDQIALDPIVWLRRRQ